MHSICALGPFKVPLRELYFWQGSGPAYFAALCSAAALKIAQHLEVATVLPAWAGRNTRRAWQVGGGPPRLAETRWCGFEREGCHTVGPSATPVCQHHGCSDSPRTSRMFLCPVIIIATVHDEAVLLVPDDLAAVQRPGAPAQQEMITAFLEVFPDAPTSGLVDPAVGPTWGDVVPLQKWLAEQKSPAR
jgi:hypothetical protein